MNIIVTGASSGIGFQLVKTLAKGSHSIVAIARNKELLNLLSVECQEKDLGHVYPISFDLAWLGQR